MTSAVASLCLLALCATAMAAPLQSGQLSLRSVLHRDAPNSTVDAPNSTVALPTFLMSLGNDCNCYFKGVCSCEASLEFMSCISDACTSGKCNCGGDNHYNWACGNMSATCPNVGLTCANGQASCMKEEAPLPSTAPAAQTVAPAAEIESEPVDAAPKQSWWDWLVHNQFTLRLVAFIVEVLPFLIAAFIYDRFRKTMRFEQAATTKIPENGFSHGLFSCFESPKITLLAWCCGPIRWADTLDKGSPVLMKYWTAVIVFVLLMGFAPLLGGLSSLILLVLCTIMRQRLRQQFGIQAGGKTVVEDCCTYTWCGCCAVAQEARQVEVMRS